MLENWTPRQFPHIESLIGQYCTLERLDRARHGDDLFATCGSENENERAKYLTGSKLLSKPEFMDQLDAFEANPDYAYYAVIDNKTGKAGGRQAFMRIDQAHGVVELGSVHWSLAIARSPITTEAFFLAVQYAFETLGYRRLEWKCDTRNEPSMKAAIRFGMTFEGIFRQHMVRNGENRDSAWYSLLDREWPRTRLSFENWLSANNFDEKGQQKQRLQDFIKQGAHA